MKKKLGPFATQRNKNAADEIPITLPPAVPRGYVNNALYPGLLTRAAVDKDLLLDVPAWNPVPDPPPDDTKDDYVDDTGNFRDGYIGTTTHPAPGPYVATIPLIRLTQGPHTYSYKVVNTYGANVAGSQTVTFIVDRRAPYETAGIRPRALQLPVGHSGPLDAQYFADNGDVAELPIPDYDAYDAQPGDTWELLEGANGDPVATGDVFPDMTVKLTLAQAKRWEGGREIHYRLRDAAGNVSTVSLALPVSIAIQPPPVLAAPGVRHALTLAGSGDRLIDRPDAALASGMQVIIPNYDADRGVDRLYTRLETALINQQVGPIALGSSPLPYDFPVSFATLRTLYGNSFGPVTMTVGYGVERGGVIYWLPPADEVTIELDLSKAGPINPNEPDLENSNLPLPILTGPISTLTNALNSSDATHDAPVAVPLWTALPAPSARPFTVVLYYAGEEVQRVAVDNTALPPSGVVDMIVAWPYISKHGNDTAIPLRYEIITTGTTNRDRSPTQGIAVNVNVISFVAPRVNGAITTPSGLVVVGCSALPPPTRDLVVHVPPHPLFQDKMIIDVIWDAFSDDEGLVSIPTASDSFSHTLNASEVVTGFDVRITPSTTFVKPINELSVSAGSVRIKYAVPILGTTPVDSAELHARVRTVLSGSTPTFCDGTPWP